MKEVKLFKDNVLGRFFYNYAGGKTLIISPALVKYDEALEDYIIEFPIQCRVKEVENYLILTPGNSKVVYLLDPIYIGKTEGIADFYFYEEDGETSSIVIVTKPTEEIKIFSGEVRFGFWEDYILILKNGKEEYVFPNSEEVEA